MKKETTIIVVDDYSIFRQALEIVINRIGNYKVIGGAKNGQEYSIYNYLCI